MSAGIIATILLTAGLLSGAEVPNATKQHVSFEQMAKTQIFNFGGVGFASAIVEGEIGYHEILSHPNAAAEFEKLFAHGNLQAKCYALVGLRTLNPKRFEVLASTLESSKVRVSTAQGCIFFEQPMSVLIKAIRSGAYVPQPQASDRH